MSDHESERVPDRKSERVPDHESERVPDHESERVPDRDADASAYGDGDPEVLSAVGEEYSAAILAAADRPRSARELSELLDVPIATCYRRIEALVGAGLLAEEGRTLSDRGRRTTVYRRTVEGVSIRFDDGSFEVAVDRRPATESTRSDER